MGKKDLIAGLEEQLNREISTALRYMLQGASISGAKNEEIRKLYLQEVIDEMEHAKYLTEQLCSLGVVPKLSPDLTAPPKEIKTMLENDIEAEKIDVKNYIRLAQLAEGEGLMALKLKMEEQAADEDEHSHVMRRMMG